MDGPVRVIVARSFAPSRSTANVTMLVAAPATRGWALEALHFAVEACALKLAVKVLPSLVKTEQPTGRAADETLTFLVTADSVIPTSATAAKHCAAVATAVLHLGCAAEVVA